MVHSNNHILVHLKYLRGLASFVCNLLLIPRIDYLYIFPFISSFWLLSICVKSVLGVFIFKIMLYCYAVACLVAPACNDATINGAAVIHNEEQDVSLSTDLFELCTIPECRWYYDTLLIESNCVCRPVVVAVTIVLYASFCFCSLYCASCMLSVGPWL